MLHFPDLGLTGATLESARAHWRTSKKAVPTTPLAFYWVFLLCQEESAECPAGDRAEWVRRSREARKTFDRLSRLGDLNRPIAGLGQPDIDSPLTYNPSRS
jgi:hypothetical protein